MLLKYHFGLFIIVDINIHYYLPIVKIISHIDIFPQELNIQTVYFKGFQDVFYSSQIFHKKISTQHLTWLIICAILHITNKTDITLNIKYYICVNYK